MRASEGKLSERGSMLKVVMDRNLESNLFQKQSKISIELDSSAFGVGSWQAFIGS